MLNIDLFNRKLIDEKSGNPFPYVDPPRWWKPPFMVGAEEHLRWFEELYKSTIGQGYWISFIVGDPGAGKTHFICYLDYLFNDAKRFKGVFSCYSAGQSKITSKDLWIDFFSNNDVISRIKDLISIDMIKSHKFRSEKVRSNILKYIEGSLSIDSLTENEIQDMASGISALLAKINAGMCMVIDNVDEYFRYLSTLHEVPENLTKEEREKRIREQQLRDLQNFFGTLRTACRDMPNFLLLVACTSPAYNIIREHAVTVDRTFAGRVLYQSRVLKTLTLSQTFELVNKYLSWWCQNNNVDLPLVEECTVKRPNGDVISLYPFSRIAIEEIYEVTGQYARDIKTICNECINRMKMEKKVWIVKDEYLAYAVDEAHKKRPQIIPERNIAKFKARRVKWMRKTMKKHLEEAEKLARIRHSFINQEDLINNFTVYLTNLGFTIEKPPSIKNSENFLMIDPSMLRILKYDKEKSVLISYIFSEAPPLGKTYYRHIEWRDISNAISYIDSGLATHILFVTLWCGGFSHSTLQYHHKISRYEPIMESVEVDDVLFKVIGAVEAEDSIRKDLIEHVDAYHFKLKEILHTLVEKSMPPEKQPRQERKEIGWY